MKRSYFLPALALVALLPACKKFVTVDPPPTQVESSEIFKSDQAAISAAVGLYSRMGSAPLSITNGGITVYAALAADELYNTASSATYDGYTANAILPTDATGHERLWNFGYRNIYQANAVMEGLSASALVTDTLKRQLRGEMLVSRAMNYFYLVNIYGDVPLELGTDYRINSLLPRTPAAQVYNQVVQDLVEAQGLLKSAYPSAAKGRPNLWTATALLARVYLYQKNWAAAEAQATAVIGSGSYALATTPATVFSAASPETIWQLPRDNSNTAEGANFVPSSATARPTFALTSFLLAALAGDGRKTSWTGLNTVSGTPYYYPSKYKVRTTTPITEYYVLLRLAEQYLIRAEARAQQNNISGAQADINRIRTRAGLANTTPADQASLLTAIEKERQVELMFEWGHRWFDLKRTGRIDAVLGAEKGAAWQPTDALFPVPDAQLRANPLLVQNPGY